MKKQIKYILVFVILLTTGVACKKEYLKPVPLTTVSDATAFDTPERILGNVRSLYANTKGSSFYGGRYIVYGDVRGEEFINETSNPVTASDVWNFSATGSSTNSVVNLWAQAYYTINLCNNAIEGITAKGPTVVPTLTNNYLGEARFIRALCYYSLLQLYARPYADGAGSKPGLPLRLTAIKGPGYSDMARSSVAQVYAQIIADLNFAEANLPLNYTGATAAELNTTRAHRNTAIALKTRVYLSMQDYANVIAEANKIVSAGTTPPFTATSGVPHALQSNIATVFSNYTTTESILSFPMSSAAGDNPGTQNQLGFYFLRNLSNPGSAEFSLNPLGIIGDPGFQSTTDTRRTSLLFFNATTSKYFVNKYQQPSPFLDWIPVMRYSEVMLNLAEALARTNTAVDARALALVNTVRRRSESNPAIVITATTQAQLINAIMLERRIEFLGEGLRNNDLMRLLQTIPAKGNIPAKAPSDQGYIWPISGIEMSLNKLMTDN